MRKTCLESVYELARKDKRIFFIGSDLGVGTLQKFKDEMPDRFFMEGVSEAHVIGMAAGLALEGKIVYVNTIATFLTRRCFEQIVLDLCLHNVNVRLIGNGGGLVYAPLGPTHLAIEDMAIFRAIPNMSIVAPADANEMRRLMPHTVDHPGPLYIRLAKGHDPLITSLDAPFEIGRAEEVRTGSDALIVTTGVTLHCALKAADRLKKDGIRAGILHLATLKPLDKKTLLEQIGRVGAVVTVEEHTLMGGLGSALSELIAEHGFNPPKRFRRIGLPDCFPDRYGSQAGLMDRYRINAESIVECIHGLLKPSRGVMESPVEVGS